MSALSSLSPMMQLTVLWGLAFAFTGLGMALLIASYDWPSVARHRVRVELPRKLDPVEYSRAVALNSLLSTSMFLIVGFVGFDAFFYVGDLALSRALLEIAGVLLLYDFLYYLLHRFAFHRWELGARWHRIHHRIRSPRAKDSLFVHPMETFLGVATMLVSMGAMGLIGGMHVLSFAVAFTLYSLLNLFVHAAIDLPWLPLSALSRHHDAHHASMRGGYYASITPIWDLVFGTAREGR